MTQRKRFPFAQYRQGRDRWFIYLSVFCAILALLLSAGFLSHSSVAQERLLDAPRAAGLVGERFDGYAVVRDPSASTEIHDIVRQVNSERQKIYEQRAAAEGVPVKQVGRIYAQEIIRSAPAGIYILQENGNWVQK